MARTKPAPQPTYTQAGRDLLSRMEALMDRLYEHEDTLTYDDLEALYAPAWRFGLVTGNMLRAKDHAAAKRKREEQSAAILQERVDWN